jgi:hypothetical protein
LEALCVEGERQGFYEVMSEGQNGGTDVPEEQKVAKSLSKKLKNALSRKKYANVCCLDA